MREGCYGDDYLIIFDEVESISASARYRIAEHLPGYKIVGLRGWDDFIVQDSNDATYIVPTLPVIQAYLEPYRLPPAGTELVVDRRYQNKIKWYVTPLVFGGDPRSEDNVVWVSHDEHAKLVNWWHGVYRSVKGQ